MKRKLDRVATARRSSHSAGLVPALFATTLLCTYTGSTQAFEVDTGNSDVKLRWDNTVKYSTAFRVKGQDTEVSGPNAGNGNPNLDDGDRNFHRGMISNRLDLLSEFDVRYQDVGARVSAAAWYDSIYNRSNANNSPATANSFSVPSDQFTRDTEKMQGRKAELLDAFVFGKVTPGDTLLNLRAGRFTQLYGESLFFGGNGIAAAQTAPDIIKALSVPNSQFKEILMPVGQLSAQWQLTPQISAGAYYQYEWRKARLPAAGSYFSFGDFLDAGGERVLAGQPLVPGGGPAAFFRGADLTARDSGQGGMQFKFKVADTEYGIYAARFHDKFPQFYFRPGVGGVNPATGRIGDYVLVYGQDIKVYGASFSTVVGETNVAGEVSIRRNMPLTATGNVVVDPTGTGDGRGNPLYPVGNTFHAQLSAISVLPASPLWQGASFVSEIAFNRRLSITKNASQLDPNVTRDASAVRFVFQPEYFQVLPGLDIQVPLGVGFGLSGFSSVNGVGMPARRTGDLSFGIKGTYQKVWNGSLTFTHFYGKGGGVIDGSAQLTGNQVYKDRDFVALSIQRTF
ncbi:DUF1302 domain-containing protein [Ralstonia wenshanensis]|uniref:DUF1302 domain-containing protein n=1 Tax=Ralstonia wenshanensis TaxID=2842456 RepID=UPI003D99E4A8